MSDPGSITQLAHPQPTLVQRKVEKPPDEVFRLEEGVRHVLHHVRSLDTRSIPTESPGPGEYSSSLNSFYSVFQTLLTERFLEQLPGTAVCILSGRRDCGPEADLTKAVSLDLIKPLLGFMSTVRSGTCAPGPVDVQSAGASLRTGESNPGTFPSLQQWTVDALSRLPSGNLLATLSALIDVTVSHTIKFMATLLQVPVDYVRLALQLGIRTPSLDEKETCEQGKNTLEPVKIGLANGRS